MVETMAYFNKYLKDNLAPISVSVGEDLDYKDLEEYVRISWVSGKQDTSMRADRYEKTCHIEGYTRKANVYAHYQLGKKILDLLNYRIKLENGDEVDIREIIDNYFELEDVSGKKVRKVDITFRIVRRNA